jgi:hypothetical protein
MKKYFANGLDDWSLIPDATRHSSFHFPFWICGSHNKSDNDEYDILGCKVE